jgi:hypothetical protein
MFGMACEGSYFTHLGEHTCAELADHTARCWGSNEFAQIGDGTFLFAALPTNVLLQ